MRDLMFRRLRVLFLPDNPYPYADPNQRLAIAEQTSAKAHLVLQCCQDSLGICQEKIPQTIWGFGSGAYE